MDLATGIMGLIGVFSGAIVSLLALIKRIDRGLDRKMAHVMDDNFERLVMKVLVDAGLTRKGHGGLWANGSTNLPDSIHTIWKSVEANSGQIHELNKNINRHS